jgi:hypothetical protein
MWYVTVKDLPEPVIMHSLAFVEVGGPLLVNGKLYEVLSIRHYDE